MIDWFMGGKPKKKKSRNNLSGLMIGKKKVKKSRDPLADLMIMPNTIIGDRITKKQRSVFKKAKKQKSFMPLFGDWDGDRVINGLDCQPRNKKKHAARFNESKHGNYRTFLKQTPDYNLDKNDFKNKYRSYDKHEFEPIKEARKRGHMKYDSRTTQRDLRNVSENTPSMFNDNVKNNPVQKYISYHDHVTPTQQRFLNSGKDRFTDTDKDGVIDGLDCQPNDPTRHMAWRKPEPYEYVEEMSPREYLRRTNSPDFSAETYWGTKDNKSQPISKLSKHIRDPNTEVDIPFVEPDGNHEGRHRAFAAEKDGVQKIKVRLPSPRSWRTKEIQESFIKKRWPHHNDPNRQKWQKEIDKHDSDKWKKRIETEKFPEQLLDRAGRKAYSEAIQENIGDNK